MTGRVLVVGVDPPQGHRCDVQAVNGKARTWDPLDSVWQCLDCGRTWVVRMSRGPSMYKCWAPESRRHRRHRELANGQ